MICCGFVPVCGFRTAAVNSLQELINILTVFAVFYITC